MVVFPLKKKMEAYLFKLPPLMFLSSQVGEGSINSVWADKVFMNNLKNMSKAHEYCCRT